MIWLVPNGVRLGNMRKRKNFGRKFPKQTSTQDRNRKSDSDKGPPQLAATFISAVDTLLTLTFLPTSCFRNASALLGESGKVLEDGRDEIVMPCVFWRQGRDVQLEHIARLGGRLRP
jgi:hypothetical protein